MMTRPDWIEADWPLKNRVRVITTTRRGGVSQPPYASQNLGMHVGDQPAAVALNRRALSAALPEVERWVWLNQAHGTALFDADQTAPPALPDADASMTRAAGCALVIMTADCLPVMLSDSKGTQVAAVHAGWRGLAEGVLDRAVAAFDCSPDEIFAWLGPAIGQAAFEVGAEVRAAFLANDAANAAHFEENDNGRWQASLSGLARATLAQFGVSAVSGIEACTLADADAWYSYRRDGVCGRMATLIYRVPTA